VEKDLQDCDFAHKLLEMQVRRRLKAQGSRIKENLDLAIWSLGLLQRPAPWTSLLDPFAFS